MNLYKNKQVDAKLTRVFFSIVNPLYQDLQETDKTFITEVFSGCVRHTKIMKVVVNGFYIQDGKSCLKADKNLYTGKTANNAPSKVFPQCI